MHMKQRKRLAYQLTFRYALLIIVAFALMRMMIDALQDYTVAAEAENGRRALELFQEKRPDIILTDIEMPVMNGLELIEAVKAERPETPIIILSCYESFVYAQRAMRSGVRSYLIKDMTGIADLERCLNEAVGLVRIAPDDPPKPSDTFEKLLRVRPVGAADIERHLDQLFCAYFKHEGGTCISELRQFYRYNLSGMLQFRFLSFINKSLISWITNETALFSIGPNAVFGHVSSPAARLEQCASPAEMCECLCGWRDTWFRLAESREFISERSQGILCYIVDHCAEELSLDELARNFFVHPVHLSRAFKSDTGINLTTMINIIRVEKAKLLLAVGNHKVNEVAYMVGYGSTQGFYNAFKKQTGLSPAQFTDGI